MSTAVPMHCEAAMHGAFVAVCARTDDPAWQRLVETIERHGRGRIAPRARLLPDGRQTAAFEGDFVALRGGTAAVASS